MQIILDDIIAASHIGIVYADMPATHQYQWGIKGERLGTELVPSFHRLQVTGVATYSLELLQQVRDPDVVYVPKNNNAQL